jgi:flagellin
MARINTNVPSLIARSNLERTQRELDVRLERLATGLRINRGADDPAGLIISERIRSDIRGAEQGIKNAERASAVIATTESSLSEVNDLLNSIKALVVEAANSGAFSDTELDANQAQIDSAIDSITRISNTARFAGLSLLDGSLDYTISGVAASAISKADILGASFVGATSIDVSVQVTASAQVGSLFLRGDLPNPGDPENGTILSQTTIEVRGPKGVMVVEFPSGASLTDAIAAINATTSFTGVEAERINPGTDASGMVFRATEYGADEFVSVKRLNPPKDPADSAFQTYAFAEGTPMDPGAAPFPWAQIGTTLNEAERDRGQDVQALINGSLANGDGLVVSLNNPNLSAKILLNEDLATRPGQSSAFSITGGGSLFQLGGEVTAQQQINIGVKSVAASSLGATMVDGAIAFLSSLKTGQENSLRSSNQRRDFSAASRILEAAIDEVSVMRGRMGALERNTLQTNVRSLQASVENLSASASLLRDADFAAETSQLTRAQILQSSGLSALALANQSSQAILQLLG